MAALLHVWAVAVGPLLHDLRPAPHAAGWTTRHYEASAPAHDELSCVLCQAMSGPALPAQGGSLLAIQPRTDAPAPASALPQPSLAASPSRARAPPQSPA